MLTDKDIANILAARRNQGQNVAFAMLDARLKTRRRSWSTTSDIIDAAIDVMAEALVA